MNQPRPPHERPTAQELATGGGANVCAKCGGAMIAYKTIRLQSRIVRYRRCRNTNCPNSIVTKQEHEEIVRDVDRHEEDEDSNFGKPSLTLVRHSA